MRSWTARSTLIGESRIIVESTASGHLRRGDDDEHIEQALGPCLHAGDLCPRRPGLPGRNLLPAAVLLELESASDARLSLPQLLLQADAHLHGLQASFRCPFPSAA